VKNSFQPENSEIVFFDGVCNLCNAFVDFLIRRNQNLLFAPLQGSTAAKLLPKDKIENLPSIVFWSHGNIYIESTAALRILARLGPGYQMITVFMVLPKFIRDQVYRFIARNRYRWFGKKDTCRLPTPAERMRFLD
jgi:predicted DCC family thiol-disulfide oxidoreductase YuxK